MPAARGTRRMSREGLQVAPAGGGGRGGVLRGMGLGRRIRGQLLWLAVCVEGEKTCPELSKNVMRPSPFLSYDVQRRKRERSGEGRRAGGSGDDSGSRRHVGVRVGGVLLGDAEVSLPHCSFKRFSIFCSSGIVFTEEDVCLYVVSYGYVISFLFFCGMVMVEFMSRHIVPCIALIAHVARG